MEYLEALEFPIMGDEKATENLHNLINEFEKQIDKELTEKQVAALIKLAKGLIASVEKEITVVTLLLHQLENRLP